MNSSTTATDPDLQSVVDLVIATVQPLRVVLFGSLVRGEERADSDVDIMVVVADGTELRTVARSLYLEMSKRHMGAPVEFHVTTPTTLERHRDDIGYYHFDAVRQGRELYAA